MRRAGRTRWWISNLVLTAGFFLVSVWGWDVVHRAIYQSWQSQELDRQIREEAPAPRAAAPAAPRGPERGALIGRLVIKRLNVRAIVREGTDADTLDVALGHVSGTALPGQDGNIGIAGHRDTLFRGLRDISRGDRIVLQTSRGSYTYNVERIGVVTPRDVDVLAPATYPAMTLVTCYPFQYVGSAPDRFIVRARLVSTP